MKSGALRRGWPWQILGAIRAVATAGEIGEILWVFFVRKQRTISPISLQSAFTKFEHNMSVGVAMKTFGTEFRKFYRMGLFFPKNILRLANLGRHNSAMITHRRKFTDKITLYGISSFHFYLWNQFKVIPWTVHSVQETSPNFCDVRRGLTTLQITLTSLSRRQPITIDY